MTQGDSPKPRRETELAEEGRALCQAFYAATKLVALYGSESQVVSEAMISLMTALKRVRDPSGDVKIRISSSTMFLNGVRVKMGLDGFLAFNYVTEMMARRDIGEMRFLSGVEASDVLGYLAAIHAVARETEKVLETLRTHMREHEVANVELAHRRALGEEDDDAVVVDLRESSIQLYFKACFIAGNLLKAMAGENAPIRKAKRVVHNLVDVLDRDETVLLALTGVKAFVEFNASHAANVCILSMCMGRRLGMHKRRLADLGIAALLHDAGRTLGENPPEGADADHTRRGALRLLKVMGFGDASLRTVLAALNHHAPAHDADGNPGSLVNRIIAVADYFDTMTTPAGEGREPAQPKDVLETMSRDRFRFDHRLARLLGRVVGAYPIASVVTLDTGGKAVVIGRNPETDSLLRPVVRMLEDAEGNKVEDGEDLDLSVENPETGDAAPSVTAVKAPCEAYASHKELISQI